MLDTTLFSAAGKAIEEAAVRKFEASLLGDIILPGSERYEQARQHWIGITDPRRPGVIVRCAGTADVVRCIDFSRGNELAIAVRAGGHSAAGDSFCDGGMVIDLSGMKAIEIDTPRRVARGDAGLTVGEFDRATERFDLAAVLGECSSVGIAGYTLGGGLGRLMGKHGAACDNLTSVELVTADGKVVRASSNENGDLFWGVRGGGGNFGIVTSFEYQIHPMREVLGGVLRYPIADIREVLSFLDDYMMNVPDEFDLAVDIGNSGVMTFAPGVTEPIVNLAVSYCGDLAAGEKALKPLRSFGHPLADTIRAMPYIQMQALSDIRPLAELGLSGVPMVIESGFIERLGEEEINIIVASLAEAPSCFWITAEHYLHGAICRLAPDRTAFCLRRSGYTTRIFAAAREPSETDESLAWVQRLRATLEPFSGDALYVNYLSEGSGEAGVKTAYGCNYERLAALKRKYDPTNFFHSNRNISPA